MYDSCRDHVTRRPGGQQASGVKGGGLWLMFDLVDGTRYLRRYCCTQRTGGWRAGRRGWGGGRWTHWLLNVYLGSSGRSGQTGWPFHDAWSARARTHRHTHRRARARIVNLSIYIGKLSEPVCFVKLASDRSLLCQTRTCIWCVDCGSWSAAFLWKSDSVVELDLSKFRKVGKRYNKLKFFDVF